MENVWVLASLWVGLALIATLLAIWLRFSTALTEIVVGAFKYQKQEGLYYTLMMSTGLTFGTISALFGLNHGIIDQVQYTHLVATVIGSAVVPTMIANSFFMPRHLLSKAAPRLVTASAALAAPESD
jgi:glutathione-regulated potassium-efflux system ancillary protein KefC